MSGTAKSCCMFELMAFRSEHVLTVELETSPRAGQVNSVVGVDPDHAASSSLSGELVGRQEPSQGFSHCQAEPAKAAQHSRLCRTCIISHNVYYVHNGPAVSSSLQPLIPTPRTSSEPQLDQSTCGNRVHAITNSHAQSASPAAHPSLNPHARQQRARQHSEPGKR